MPDQPDQSSLSRFADPDYVESGITNIVKGVYGQIRNTLEDIGLDTDWMGQQPYDVAADTDEDIWVYQYVTAYSKGTQAEGYAFDADKGDRQTNDGSSSPEVQFKSGIYVIGEPTDELQNRIKSVDNGRLRYVFNSGIYAGYMDGFGFQEKREYVQLQPVSAREVDDKGVSLGEPWFEVEAYDDDGGLEGFADGTFNPFSTRTSIEEYTVGQEPPEQEVWRVRTTLNRARNANGQWEIGPRQNTGASERARNAQGKSVYIGPYEIGKITSRGTVWLRREYDRQGPYADKATITSQSGIPPQALQQGTRLFKYREDDDAVYLSTTEPATGFDAIDPDAISGDQTGSETRSREVTEILLDEDESTQFIVLTDENQGRLLGLYDPVEVRDVEQQTTLI